MQQTTTLPQSDFLTLSDSVSCLQVELLLQHQGDPSVVSQQSKTPLDLACEFGKYRVSGVQLTKWKPCPCAYTHKHICIYYNIINIMLKQFRKSADCPYRTVLDFSPASSTIDHPPTPHALVGGCLTAELQQRHRFHAKCLGKIDQVRSNYVKPRMK